ncbi:hypothetical protein D3C72_2491310 [compost metagenome]
MVSMAGVGFSDRVEQGDHLQFTLPMQVQNIATANRQVLTAQPVVIDLQLLADQALCRCGTLAQGDGLLMAATA